MATETFGSTKSFGTASGSEHAMKCEPAWPKDGPLDEGHRQELPGYGVRDGAVQD